MFSLQPPRHIPTLPKPEWPLTTLMSAFASCGDAGARAYVNVPKGDNRE
jgi:hypothetical protein